MTGDHTLFRFAPEASGSGAPTDAWIGASCRVVDARSVARTSSAETIDPGRAGSRYAVLTLDVPATAAGLDGLAAAALLRDADGGIAACTAEIAGAAHGGAARLSGAVVRRFRVRAGLARDRLEFELELVGKTLTATEPFEAGPSGAAFSFAGVECEVAGGAVDLKEFSISVNNNIFLGPPDETGGLSFITPGRQEVCGYICIAGDRTDLIDGCSHELVVRLPGECGVAVVSVAEVIFNWHRRIESIAAGGLDVLYFEGAGGAITGGVDVRIAC